MVVLLDEQGQVVARGLANYGAEDARKLMGKPSGMIEQLLGYMGEVELVHRDNLALA
jgi:glutamate 5-kinase